MSYFLKSGNTFRVSTKEAMDLHEKLPAGNYVVKEMPMDGPLYLEHIESFEIKGKRYGDLDKNTDLLEVPHWSHPPWHEFADKDRAHSISPGMHG